MEFKVYKELDQDIKNSIIVNATLAATFLTASIYNTVFSTDQVNMFTFESVINNPLFYSITTALAGCYFASKARESIDNKPYVLKK